MFGQLDKGLVAVPQQFLGDPMPAQGFDLILAT
jgi:hypothetical protein